MDITQGDLDTYMKLVSEEWDLAMEIWPTLGLKAGAFIEMLSKKTGILIADRDPGLIEVINENDLNGAL